MIKKFFLLVQKSFKYLARFLISFGFRQNLINSLINLPRYFRDKKSWLKQGGKINKEFLMLNDFFSESGVCSGDYFHQDLLVAKLIHQNKPKKHIDVGSRIDGFVAHVASFREIEVIDIRALSMENHENIKFLKFDITEKFQFPKTDSLSCLHAIEHFGLGRYGDRINTLGYLLALDNLISMLEKDGVFYISFPIGRANEVHFNSQRVFNPNYFLNLKLVKKNLNLIRFDYVNQKGDLNCQKNILDFLDNEKYGCGIFTFKKV
tara:strand:+ start:3836 stop:4624 length:789 start_codon:yes stop_codon:yes gene_type:complete